MKKIERRALSILTALLFMNATNTHVINRTQIINATKLNINGKIVYAISEGTYYVSSNKGILKTVEIIEPRLAKEDYLLEDNSYNLELKQIPKIKSKK